MIWFLYSIPDDGQQCDKPYWHTVQQGRMSGATAGRPEVDSLSIPCDL